MQENEAVSTPSTLLWKEQRSRAIRRETLNPAQIIQDVKAGGREDLGTLLELYRNYLRLLARIEIGRRLQGKLDASDLVQEPFLDAHRHFPGFQGNDERQFVCWLRQILAAKVANLVRHYFGTQGR